jgi:DNA-binding transcriptional regulator YdaS (Cro superfamily)
MKISEYLNQENLTQVAFSRSAGISPIYLNAIVRGRRTPSKAVALRIEEATGGAVTRMELLYPEQKEGAAQGESPAT